MSKYTLTLREVAKSDDAITFIFSNDRGISLDFVSGTPAAEIVAKLYILIKAIERDEKLG